MEGQGVMIGIMDEFPVPLFVFVFFFFFWEVLTDP